MRKLWYIALTSAIFLIPGGVLAPGDTMKIHTPSEEIIFLKDTVTLTVYQAEEKQTDSTPDDAACGHVDSSMIYEERYIALSDDLWEKYDLRCGDRVKLVNLSTYMGRKYPNEVHLTHDNYIVWDAMHSRWRKYVDLLTPHTRYDKRTVVLIVPQPQR